MRRQDFIDSDPRAEELRADFKGLPPDELRVMNPPAISDDGKGDICLELFTIKGPFALILNHAQFEYTHRVFDRIRQRGMEPMTREEGLLRQVWNKEDSDAPFHNAFIVDESLACTIVESLPPAEAAAVLEYWRNKMVEAIDEVVQRVKAEAVVPEQCAKP